MNHKTRSIDKKFRVGVVPIQEESIKKVNPMRQKKLMEIRDTEVLKSKSEQLKKIIEKKLLIKFGK